jgi:ribosomal protein L7Ae-like RNA K-turn-binding protein
MAGVITRLSHSPARIGTDQVVAELRDGKYDLLVVAASCGTDRTSCILEDVASDLVSKHPVLF